MLYYDLMIFSHPPTTTDSVSSSSSPRVPPGVPMPGWSLGLTKMMVPGPGATEWRRRCWRWLTDCVERKLRRLKNKRKISIIDLIWTICINLKEISLNIMNHMHLFLLPMSSSNLSKTFQNIQWPAYHGISLPAPKDRRSDKSSPLNQWRGHVARLTVAAWTSESASNKTVKTHDIDIPAESSWLVH